MTEDKKPFGRLGVRLAQMVALLSLAIPAEAAQIIAPPESFGAALVRTGAALLFILGLFFLLVYVMKRYFPNVFGGPAPGSSASNAHIELLATRPIGPKRYLHLIRIGKRELLLGSSEQGVNKLGEWESTMKPESKSQIDEPAG
ncbi:MAG: flagellar biosynthetic protein FliO [bacterium]